MFSWMRGCSGRALLASLVAGCAPDAVTVQRDGASDVAAVDAATLTDSPVADVTSPDGAALDARAPDAPAPDAPAPDAPPLDRPIVDALVDAPQPDRPTTPDATATPDVPPPDVGCTGAAPAITVTAPTPNEVIETCTESGARVFYDFRAGIVAAPAIRQVTVAWRAPDGSLVAPPPPPLGAPPYAWRRQVGGMMVDVPPLAIISGALRGTWHFEVTATDTCGRATTGRQPFSLTYTTRRCPNP